MATAGLKYRIDIGNVISMGFRTLGRNFLPYLAFALLLVGLPNFLLQYLLWDRLFESGPEMFTSPYYWLTVLASWISAFLLQGIIVRSAILDLSGRSPGIAESGVTALRKLLPMIGLWIVSGICTMIGFIFLIVPGVILLLMWAVAVPALVQEQRGVFESLGRSNELTSGSRGWIFILMLLYLGVTWTISGFAAMLMGFQMAALDAGAMTMPIVAQALAQTINGLLLAVMLAALYVELRQFKEGASPDHLAQIFA